MRAATHRTCARGRTSAAALSVMSRAVVLHSDKNQLTKEWLEKAGRLNEQIENVL
jgi:hypothetical protein